MLQAATLQFLKGLKNDNNKEWFEKHRTDYDTAKADFSSMVENIISSTAKFDAPIGLLKPKDCIFRINRDVRFSKEKIPYKTNMAASLTNGGKKAMIAGYYFHCEPGQSFVGGGFYMPMPPELAKLRQEIDYGFDEWKKIIHNKKFKNQFTNGVQGTDTLVRPPKGYDESNPAIGFLKMKGFIVTHPLTDDQLTEKNAVKEIVNSFTIMKPLIDFLNRAVD